MSCAMILLGGSWSLGISVLQTVSLLQLQWLLLHMVEHLHPALYSTSSEVLLQWEACAHDCSGTHARTCSRNTLEPMAISQKEKIVWTLQLFSCAVVPVRNKAPHMQEWRKPCNSCMLQRLGTLDASCIPQGWPD